MEALNENEEKFINKIVSNVRYGISTDTKYIRRLADDYGVSYHDLPRVGAALREKLEELKPEDIPIDVHREFYALDPHYARRDVICATRYEDAYDRETAMIIRLNDFALGDSPSKRAARAAKAKRQDKIALWIMIGVMAFFMLLGLILGD